MCSVPNTTDARDPVGDAYAFIDQHRLQPECVRSLNEFPEWAAKLILIGDELYKDALRDGLRRYGEPRGRNSGIGYGLVLSTARRLGLSVPDAPDPRVEWPGARAYILELVEAASRAASGTDRQRAPSSIIARRHAPATVMANRQMQLVMRENRDSLLLLASRTQAWWISELARRCQRRFGAGTVGRTATWKVLMDLREPEHPTTQYYASVDDKAIYHDPDGHAWCLECMAVADDFDLLEHAPGCSRA